MLSTRELTCSRGDRSLFRSLSFQVSPGELLQVNGRNGSGKTTLLRTLCGLTQPATGEVSWNGENISDLGDQYLKQLLYVGHKNGLHGDLTALENLRYVIGMEGLVAKNQAQEALESFGLKAIAHLPSKVLSQGQKRRVALARLLLHPRNIWVLDEPLTALDAATVELVEQLLVSHTSNGGLAILTSHQKFKLGGVQTKELNLDHVA